MNFSQRLRNAIYSIKFSQLPGTHDNGKVRKKMTVEQALDSVAAQMGLYPIRVRPLYEIDWNLYKLHSSVTGQNYDIVMEYDAERVIVNYEGKWIHCDNSEDAIDIVARKERGTYA